MSTGSAGAGTDRVASSTTIEVVPTAVAMSDAAAEQFVRAADQAIRDTGRCVVALSGGSTPRPLYQQLASPSMAARVDWPRVHVCWSDERCVPPTHADSNYRMVRELLLDHVPIPASQIHRMHGEEDPVAGAAAYERTLRDLLRTASGPPRTVAGARFDFILLGLGADGHTASLFPGAHAVTERERWVVAEEIPALSMWRITLAPAVINAAAVVLCIVSGAEKASVLQRVLEGPRHPEQLPAQVIAPTAGRLHWLVDAAAAQCLPRR